MSRRFTALRSVAQLASLSRLGRFTPGLRVLMYHSIGGPALGDTTGIFSVRPEMFKRHAACLAAFPARRVALTSPVIPADDVALAVTFDDGYRDNLTVAAPLLAQAGIPFTVFIATDFVRTGAPGFLTIQELRELASVPGATIGAHSKTHRMLPQLGDADLREELAGSKAFLEDLLGMAILTVAYPYGRADRRVREAANEAGFEAGVCTRFDVNRPGRDRLMLNRCNIELEDTPRTVLQKMRGDWDWYRLRTPDPLEDR